MECFPAFLKNHKFKFLMYLHTNPINYNIFVYHTELTVNCLWNFSENDRIVSKEQ